MSLLDFGGAAPTVTTVPIDAGTSGLIDATSKRAGGSTQSFADAQNNGVSEGANTAQQSNQALSQQNAQSGNQDDAVNSAIRNQYNSQAGANVGRMKDAYAQQATFQKAAAIQQSAAQAMARQNVQLSTYQNLMQAYNNTEAARASVLSSILGAGGTVGGMALGNKKQRAKGTVQSAIQAQNSNIANIGAMDASSDDSAVSMDASNMGDGMLS